MSGVINGILNIVGTTGPNGFINNQSSNISITQTVENGVLGGPISVPVTITVTGTLSIV
tara:strand:- start:280 stop:456 length:177 start_codon:yes stop_codon:yes gene_type:complete